jgi:hypothetical protein
MSQLFEYAVFLDEKTDKDGEVVSPAKVLVKPTTVLAKDDKQVALLAAREIPADQIANLDRIQVVVRPF